MLAPIDLPTSTYLPTYLILDAGYHVTFANNVEGRDAEDRSQGKEQPKRDLQTFMPVLEHEELELIQQLVQLNTHFNTPLFKLQPQQHLSGPSGRYSSLSFPREYPRVAR